MNRVVFQHVSYVVNIEQVIDSYYFDVISLLGCSENQTSDTAKAVNTNFYFFHLDVLC